MFAYSAESTFSRMYGGACGMYWKRRPGMKLRGP